MIEHLPILQVALPLIAAPVCLLLRSRVWANLWTRLISWLCFGSALTLLHNVRESGPISYLLGGWAPPVGIEYRITLTNAYVLVVVTAIASVVLLFDWRGGLANLPKGRSYLYYASFLLLIAGLSGMTVTGDAFNTFVFLEVSSLSSYSLIALGPGRRALMAAYSYLIMGTIGGTFVLVGIGFLYQMTGTLNFADLAVRLEPVLHTRTAEAGFAFVVVGLSIKLAVFPLHQWLPNAYSRAPGKVSAFLAGTATKVSYYVLLRFIFTVFGAAWVFGELRLQMLLIPLSLLAMFICSIAAIYQYDLKRTLAYSSIAQVGYMTLGLSLANQSGLTGGLVHMFNHGLMKSGLFLVMACIAYRMGDATIDDIAGLGKRMPFTMAAFVVGGLSLIGVPGTVGFVSKWYLVVGALDAGQPWIAVLILLSSLLALAYVWRIVEAAYFRTVPAGESAPVVREDAPLSMLAPTWILIGATVVFGVWTSLTAGIAGEAASQLLEAMPWR